MSLARRFLLANLVVVVAASVAVGAWTGLQVESGVIGRTAAMTGLYIESFVEPGLASLATGTSLTTAEIAALDSLVDSTPLGEKVVSFRVWLPDGTIVYSPNRPLIGQRFALKDELQRAIDGELSAEMTDLSGPENTYEHERWNRLLEMYVPVRERGSGRVIAVTEFYQLPDEMEAAVGAAQLNAWAVVALVAVVSYLLLAGLVKQGSDTIDRQQVALRERVADLSATLEQNARLHRRLRRAADRTTALNEAGLRRIGSDLHDGPAQTLALALLRVDEPEAGAVVSEAVTSALADLRLIAAGLRSPAFDAMTVEAVVRRAVREHERRTGHGVGMAVDSVPANAPDVIKIGLFRVLQEALSNASRHAGGKDIEVVLAGTPTGIRLEVLDGGPGFNPDDIRSDALGLAGMRERAELLGGTFAVQRRETGGSIVELELPLDQEASA